MNFRPNYVGLAAGRQGIGARLKTHEGKRDDWQRFCWFSFDAVVNSSMDGWSSLRHRGSLTSIPTNKILRECEALMITILGSRDQSEMRFQRARRWEQLRESDFLRGGIARKVAADGYTDAWARVT